MTGLRSIDIELSLRSLFHSTQLHLHVHYTVHIACNKIHSIQPVVSFNISSTLQIILYFATFAYLICAVAPSPRRNAPPQRSNAFPLSQSALKGFHSAHFPCLPSVPREITRSNCSTSILSLLNERSCSLELQLSFLKM